MSQLGNALFTTTQQKLLGLLYGQPKKSFYINEILRITGMGVATIKRELDRMVSAGVLELSKRGNQHHYQANPHCPIYQELLSIVNKTFGIAEVIRTALEPLANDITWAFIFGSVASSKEGTASDIDLIIIGDITFSEAVERLYPIQQTLGREINPKIYTVDEWKKSTKKKMAFLKEILVKPRINLIGNENGLREFTGKVVRKN